MYNIDIYKHHLLLQTRPSLDQTDEKSETRFYELHSRSRGSYALQNYFILPSLRFIECIFIECTQIKLYNCLFDRNRAINLNKQ